MVDGYPSPPLRARVIGRGAVVTLEDPEVGTRNRMRIVSRSGRIVEVEPLPGSGVLPCLRNGAKFTLRAARPSGLFCFQATVEGTTAEGRGVLRLDDTRPRRRQLREYFRMPVRFGVILEVPTGEQMAPMLRARNLSGSGILVLDPDGLLPASARVRIGIPWVRAVRSSGCRRASSACRKLLVAPPWRSMDCPRSRSFSFSATYSGSTDGGASSGTLPWATWPP